ncbi:hypothetical protein L1987_13991 [Smallanthus sonchifolius]|uniref:Uncharacterized protein n=1 Tax=Smallanthus sonchifolius TaxID=185202 RepID=A0ACB9JHY7_9ASTR|nr:hypothetical protein L1987_13991 [Smallanthus sonchifolius]
MEMVRRRGSSADLAAYTLNLVGTPKWTFMDRPSSSRLPRIPRSGSGGSLVIPVLKGDALVWHKRCSAYIEPAKKGGLAVLWSGKENGIALR